MSDSFTLEWIADSGAGRDLASERAFLEQGVPMTLDICEWLQMPGSTFGKASFQVMDDCPLVRSLGTIVEEEKRPGSLAVNHFLVSMQIRLKRQLIHPPSLAQHV